MSALWVGALFGAKWQAIGQTTAAVPTPAPAAIPQQGKPQQPVKNADGTYTVRANARLVVLDAVVTDKQGNIVTDLKREDFTVTDAGEAETIRDFVPSGEYALAPDITIHSTAELDRLAPKAPVNIVLLDEFNTRFEDMAFARYSLKQYWKKQPDKLAMPTMLIAVSLQKFEVLKDYTQDKQALLDALDRHFAAYPWQAHQYAWAAERFSTAFATLTRVAEATQGHTGHKNMIWIGRGFPAVHFEDQPLDTVDRLNSVVQNTVNLLRDSRVTLYTIDPAGIQVTNTYGSAAEFNDPFGGNFQFNKLAKATGGSALYGRNDVDAEIGTSIRDGGSFYTLTYRPESSLLNPEKFRKIEVKVDRPGLKVTTREGYYLQRPRRLEDLQKPSRRLANDLAMAETSTMVYDAVPMTMTEKSGSPGQYLIHVDATGVAWHIATDTEPRYSEAILLVTQFDKKGKELKRDGKSMKFSAPKDAPPTGRYLAPLNFLYTLQREPKAVRARVVLRMVTGRIGTADLDLTGASVAPAQ
jgi:VWFA-related protein